MPTETRLRTLLGALCMLGEAQRRGLPGEPGVRGSFHPSPTSSIVEYSVALLDRVEEGPAELKSALIARLRQLLPDQVL